MPTETSPTLKMNTSHDPATRIRPDAERENTPPLGGASARGAVLVDMTLLCCSLEDARNQ
jgi:hypothetical protein